MPAKESPDVSERRLKGYLIALGVTFVMAIGIAWFGAHVIPDHDVRHDSGGSIGTSKLVDALIADHAANGEPSYRFPELSPTPSRAALMVACEDRGRGARVDIEEVEGPDGGSLAAALSESRTRWAISVQSEGSGENARALVLAARDYDCDGIWWTIEREVWIEDGVARTFDRRVVRMANQFE